MIDREKVIKGLEHCANPEARCSMVECPYFDIHARCWVKLERDALELLKEQEQRRRLEVHNIGNVDIPDGVTIEQFHAIMDNVVQALEHADKGESWPYAEAQREYEAAVEDQQYCERYEPTYNPDDGSM